MSEQGFATTKDVPDGYWTDGKTVYEKRAGMLWYASGGGFGGGMFGKAIEPATPAQIAEFQAERDRVRVLQRARDDANEALLNKYGLSLADFVRFRACSEQDGKLYVRTRENGIGEMSIAAIKKGNVIAACADDFDSTYQRYEFAPPLARETNPAPNEDPR